MDVANHRIGFSLIEVLVAVSLVGILSALITPAVQKLRASADRINCANHLRQIGLSLHQYHGDQGTFPPGSGGHGPGVTYPLRSWMSFLLPYIDREALARQTESAYEIAKNPHLNPPHVGVDTVIPLFICPSDGRITEAQTISGLRVAFNSYLGVQGTDILAHNGVLYMASKVRAGDILDGTSNTLAVGERPPNWTLNYGWWYAGHGQLNTGSGEVVLGARERNVARKHRDGCPRGPYHFTDGDVNKPCHEFHFWSLHPSGTHFLTADGSVHFLSYSADVVLPALATRADGEPVELPD